MNIKSWISVQSEIKEQHQEDEYVQTDWKALCIPCSNVIYYSVIKCVLISDIPTFLQTGMKNHTGHNLCHHGAVWPVRKTAKGKISCGVGRGSQPWVGIQEWGAVEVLRSYLAAEKTSSLDLWAVLVLLQAGDSKCQGLLLRPETSSLLVPSIVSN